MTECQEGRGDAVEYGIAAGHWRETVSTGNGVRITYYDALWRPALVRQYDAANIAGTQSFVKKTYDASGRVTFASYPSTSSTPSTGVWTTYDALGRVMSTSQDSELGLLTTTVAYGTPFKTTVTNPRSKSTATTFQAYDQPTTDWPRTITAPESVTTDILRDPFGKPESITRSGPYGGSNVSVTRAYVYDPYQRLCKTIEPESGTTIVAYTADDLIQWSADGQTSSGTTQASCVSDRNAILASQKISRTYDPRHRELTRSTTAGTENVTTTYYADGQINTLTAANPGTDVVTTTYTYNNRRLLVGEVLQVNTLLPWTFAYAYNANGHLSSQTYPGNLLVGYAPDGLGRPTQAGTFASNVTYYPNGAMAGFTYGNGIVHSMAQNARQLPSRSLDSYVSGGITTKVLDDTFAYDANGNVLSLTDASNAATADNRTWGVDPTLPTLYDGLDRLTRVKSAHQWGLAAYTYDPLDNLRTNQLGASTLNYSYDIKNQLATLSNGLGNYWAIGSDVRGNVTSNAMRNQAYQFDLAHRMNAVTGKESYLYDGNGRRARTLNSVTGSIEYFGYGADGRLLADWSNRRGVRNNYIYLGNTLVGLYEVNIVNGLGTVTPKYQHTDALGSPVVTTNASKTVLSRMSYTPYGQPTLPIDGVGYTGHFIDVGTQLTYMQQRYYDPQIGRFLSIDPMLVELNRGQNFNRYRYANNSPYGNFDPDGRQTQRIHPEDDPEEERRAREERYRKGNAGGTSPMDDSDDYETVRSIEKISVPTGQSRWTNNGPQVKRTALPLPLDKLMKLGWARVFDLEVTETIQPQVEEFAFDVYVTDTITEAWRSRSDPTNIRFGVPGLVGDQRFAGRVWRVQEYSQRRDLHVGYSFSACPVSCDAMRDIFSGANP